MSGSELKRAKKEVRARVRAMRDSLSDHERSRRSRAITCRLLALPEIGAARTVMAFWSFGSEVSTVELIRLLDARGIRVALPRIDDDDIEPMTWRPGEPTSGTAFGALEPASGERLAPAEVDAIVTPAVAFDRAGRRVGYGGGYYDRLFRRVRAGVPRIGIGFDLQVLDEPLPAGHFDLRVDLVVTESGVVRFEPRDPDGAIAT